MPCHLTICLCKPLYTSVQSRHIALERSRSNRSLVTTTSTALIPKPILDEVDTHDERYHEFNPYNVPFSSQFSSREMRCLALVAHNHM